MTDEIATPSEPVSASAVPPADHSPRVLLARSRAAAKAFTRPEEKLGWSEALDAAPWPKGAPPAFEGDFRRAFAEALVKRGIATEARDQAGRARAPEKRPWQERESKLASKLFRATDAELREQEAKAKKAGLSWNAWVRRVLALAD